MSDRDVVRLREPLSVMSSEGVISLVADVLVNAPNVSVSSSDFVMGSETVRLLVRVGGGDMESLIDHVTVEVLEGDSSVTERVQVAVGCRLQVAEPVGGGVMVNVALRLLVNEADAVSGGVIVTV